MKSMFFINKGLRINGRTQRVNFIKDRVREPLDVFAVSLYHDFARPRRRKPDSTYKEIAGDSYLRLLHTDPDILSPAISESVTRISQRKGDCPALAVYSLWTTSGNSDSARNRLFALSDKCPVVFEELDNDGYLYVKILHKKKTCRIVEQRISESSELTAPVFNLLINDINGGKRYWEHPETGHRFLILICGEINAVMANRNGKVFSCHVEENINIKEKIHGVINPSHTRFGPQAIREKQKYLSERFGATITCNNTSTFCWKGGGISDLFGINPSWKRGKKIVNYLDGLNLCNINKVELR